jgi:hypothetical protein
MNMNAAYRSRLCAVGLVAASTIGVLLGNSTIAAINPAHFRGPTIHARDVVVASNQAEPAPLYMTQYSRDEAMLVRAAVCPGCDSAPGAQLFTYSTAVPYFGSREERAAADARERRAIDAAYALREQRREAARRHGGMGGPFEGDSGGARGEAGDSGADRDSPEDRSQ